MSKSGSSFGLSVNKSFESKPFPKLLSYVFSQASLISFEYTISHSRSDASIPSLKPPTPVQNSAQRNFEHLFDSLLVIPSTHFSRPSSSRLTVIMSPMSQSKVLHIFIITSVETGTPFDIRAMVAVDTPMASRKSIFVMSLSISSFQSFLYETLTKITFQ